MQNKSAVINISNFFIQCFMCITVLISALISAQAYAGTCPNPSTKLQINNSFQTINFQNVYTFSWLSWLIDAENDTIAAWMNKGLVKNYKIITSIDADTKVIVANINNQIVVTYRGTVNAANLFTDVKFIPISGAAYGFPGNIHAGFLQNYNSTWKNVKAAITEIGGNTRDVWLTGHSMGAATATLAAYTLNNEGFNVLGMYGFGAPLMGDSTFAASYDSQLKYKTFLFKNGMDIVPHIPPPPALANDFTQAVTPSMQPSINILVNTMQYAHHGTHFTIVPNQGISADYTPLQSDRAYWQQIKNGGILLPLTLVLNPSLTNDHASEEIYCHVEAITRDLP